MPGVPASGLIPARFPSLSPVFLFCKETHSSSANNGKETTILIPRRFLLLTSHLVLCLTLLMARWVEELTFDRFQHSNSLIVIAF